MLFFHFVSSICSFTLFHIVMWSSSCFLQYIANTSNLDEKYWDKILQKSKPICLKINKWIIVFHLNSYACNNLWYHAIWCDVISVNMFKCVSADSAVNWKFNSGQGMLLCKFCPAIIPSVGILIILKIGYIFHFYKIYKYNLPLNDIL